MSMRFSLKSIVQCDGNVDDIYDYTEARRKCALKFTYSNQLPSRADADREFKATGLLGQFPLPALFTVAWNINKDSNRWMCCGGQTGLLHIMNFDK